MDLSNQKNEVDFEIAIIGAGFAGLAVAIRLLKSGKTSFVVFERADEVGGTWRDNIYPGCTCDIPSHLYSFSFKLNPNWSRMYSPQQEIWDYMIDCVEKFGLRKHIQFNSEIIRTEFNEKKAYWTLNTQRGEKTNARVVVGALGPLNRPSIPKLRGMDHFQGKFFHSSNWDYDYELKGKKVAVIGTGASAIQFVPQIAGTVEKLYLFQRTPPWIVPKPDRAISNFEKKLFKIFPLFQKLHRSWIFWMNELRGLAFFGNKTLSKMGRKVALTHIEDSIADKELRKKVTPDYEVGCKRVLISNDYYPSLQKPNVELISEGIEEIRSHSIVSKEGKERAIDTIIFGTGFIASEYICDLQIVGLKGENLFEKWLQDGPEAYYGTTVSGFPNLLFMVGPNTGLGHNSIIHMIESQVNYLMNYLKVLKKSGKNSFMDLKKEVQDAFNTDIQNKLTSTVWASGCKSWYLTGKGKNTTIWPGLNVSYRKKTRKVNPADYSLINIQPIESAKEMENSLANKL